MQFEDVWTELDWFKKGKKRDFRKNAHFKMAVAQKTIQIPVAKHFYLQNSILGVFLKLPTFAEIALFKVVGLQDMVPL